MKRLKKVLPVLLLLAGFALYYYDTQFATDEDFVPNTADPRIAYFQEQLPYRIVKAAEADINRDGRKDLVLIWSIGRGYHHQAHVPEDPGPAQV